MDVVRASPSVELHHIHVAPRQMGGGRNAGGAWHAWHRRQATGHRVEICDSRGSS